MKRSGKKAVVAVSGGPDSVYLLLEMKLKGADVVAAHLNHRTRGRDSDADQRFVEELGRRLGIPVASGKVREDPAGRRREGRGGTGAEGKAASEGRMRKARYRFLESVRRAMAAERILVAHIADDQVETVLMRILEGAGVSGLKGIPRKTAGGIERPILDVWREDILESLRKRKVPYRVDRSNRDIRFERNWIRHVLIPLLEKRYGRSVKKRIFALGERFREIDGLLEIAARKWMKKHVVSEQDVTVVRGGRPEASGKAGGAVAAGRRGGSGGPAGGGVRLPRETYSRLPAVVRKKVLQLLCFERARVAPNERLLESMDRLVRSGGPSARLAVGAGATLSCRYGEALLRAGRGSGAGARGAAGKRGMEEEARPKPTAPKKGKKRAPARGGPAEETAGRKRSGATGRKQGRPATAARGGAGVRLDGPGRYRIVPGKGEPGGAADDLISWVVWEEKKGRVSAARARLIADGERAAVFSGAELLLPLSVRPLRAGDRIRPLGLAFDKKVKEVLIDRKVPREERWGRPVVCDAEGSILWIPGVVRSAHAPVTAATRRAVVLRMEPSPDRSVQVVPPGGSIPEKGSAREGRPHTNRRKFSVC